MRVLERGAGHVAVWARDGATARAQARRALLAVEVAAVLNVSARTLNTRAAGESAEFLPLDCRRVERRFRALLLGLLECAKAVGKPAVILVEDAGEADAAALERVRRAVECTPDAVEWLRIVLIGDERLVHLLDDPAATALCSHVSERVHVTPSDCVMPAPSMTTRPVMLDYVALVTLCVGLVSLMVLSYLPRPSADTSGLLADGPHVDRPRENVEAAPKVATVSAGDVDAEVAEVLAEHPVPAVEPVHAEEISNLDVGRRDAAAPVRAGAPVEAVAVQAAPDAAMPAADVGDVGDVKVNAVEAPAAPLPVHVEPRDPQPDAPPSGDDDGNAESLRESSVAPALHDSLGVARSRRVVLEVGVFREASRAYAAQRRLKSSVGRIVVARVEGAQSPLYSLRLVGVSSSRDLAKAERELRRLGYEPKRHEEPSGIARFSRRLRPAWASLF